MSRRDPSAITAARWKAGDGSAPGRAACSRLLAVLRFPGLEPSATVRGPIGPNVTDNSRSGFDMTGKVERSPESSASIRIAPGETKPSSRAVVSSDVVGPKMTIDPGTPAQTINVLA